MNQLELDARELEAKLARARVRQEAAANPPQPLNREDWSPVRELCLDRIAEIARGEYEDSDLEGYIAEAALQAVFGPDVFMWINAVAR